MPRPSQRGNIPVDPLFPETDLRGPGPLSQGQAGHLERGTIISVDARGHIYRVALNSGRTMQMSRIRTHPGDLALLPVQTIVVVTWALGLPYILGVLPREVSSTSAESAEIPQTVTDVPGHGGEDPAMTSNLAANALAPTEPRDIMPGDFVGLSPDGASVSALHGQVAQIRGGPLAKVQAFGDNDLVRIIGGVLETITWMGESRVVNNGGKTSFIWRGGTDQITQTGPDEQKYTIRLDVGHTGDVIRLEVCNRVNQVLFRFHVSAAGACEIYAAGGLNQHGGGAAGDVNPTRIHGSRDTSVTGSSAERISGNSTHSCQGSHRRDVVGNDTRNIGGGQSIYVTNDHSLQVGGSSEEVVVGTKTVASGGIVHEVLPDGDYTVNVATGDITFTPTTGSFKVLTANPGAIEFGFSPVSHAVKFEELQSSMASFKAQLDNLFRIVRSHEHEVLTPPGSPVPVAAPSVSLATGLSAPLLLDLSSARSRTVKTT